MVCDCVDKMFRIRHKRLTLDIHIKSIMDKGYWSIVFADDGHRLVGLATESVGLAFIKQQSLAVIKTQSDASVLVYQHQ
jgi:hypothetical protein